MEPFQRFCYYALHRAAPVHDKPRKLFQSFHNSEFSDVSPFLLAMLVASNLGDLRRERMLPKPSGVKVSSFLYDYSRSKGIYRKSNYVNPDHAHAVIDLPTRYSIEEVLQLLKGASSHWINANRIIAGKFTWRRGYSAFSVSHSNLDAVVRYIEDQEEHHRRKSFAEELSALVKVHGLEWHDDAADEAEPVS